MKVTAPGVEEPLDVECPKQARERGANGFRT
jgi:hypothetical protein